MPRWLGLRKRLLEMSRVFSCETGAKLYELRRGLKRTASIYRHDTWDTRQSNAASVLTYKNQIWPPLFSKRRNNRLLSLLKEHSTIFSVQLKQKRSRILNCNFFHICLDPDPKQIMPDPGKSTGSGFTNWRYVIGLCTVWPHILYTVLSLLRVALR